MKLFSPISLLVASLVALCGCDSEPPSRACTPPRDYWQKPHFIGGLEPVRFQVTVDHQSRVDIGGRKASMDELAKHLALVAAIQNPAPQVLLDTEMGAECRTIEAVRHQIDRSMNCRTSGQCAEGSRTVWMELPLPPGTPPA